MHASPICFASSWASPHAPCLGAVLGATRGSLHGATSSAQDGAVDSVQWCALLALLALLALTALVTNDQLRLAPTDGAPMMLAIAIAAGHHLELRYAPSRASELRTSEEDL